jgi:hypothetical protein
MLSKVVGQYVGLTYIVAGCVIGLWPMDVSVLGTGVGGYPAPFYLVSGITSPKPDDDFAGALQAAVVHEAFFRTLIAGLIIAVGVLLVVYSWLTKPPQPEVAHVSRPGWPPA